MFLQTKSEATCVSSLFDIYFKLALKSGNTSAKRAALYTTYYNNEILIEDYIEELIETDLDYEDLSYISSISEYLMQKDTSIKLFNIILNNFFISLLNDPHTIT